MSEQELNKEKGETYYGTSMGFLSLRSKVPIKLDLLFLALGIDLEARGRNNKGDQVELATAIITGGTGPR